MPKHGRLIRTLGCKLILWVAQKYNFWYNKCEMTAWLFFYYRKVANKVNIKKEYVR